MARSINEAYIPIKEQGLLQYEIKDFYNNTYSLAWEWNTPDIELNNSGTDLAMLENISKTGNGKILDIDNYYIPKTKWSFSRYKIDNFLFLIALILFVIELFFRSTSFGQLSMLKAVFSVWWINQKKLLEVIKNAKLPKIQIKKEKPDYEKTMDAYKYLAKKIQERNKENNKLK